MSYVRAHLDAAAVLITMIGVGVAGHQGGVTVTANLKFSSGFLAVTDIVSVGRDAVSDAVLPLFFSQIFAYAGS